MRGKHVLNECTKCLSKVPPQTHYQRIEKRREMESLGMRFQKWEFFFAMREAGFKGQFYENTLWLSLLCPTRGETKVTLPKDPQV